MMRSNLSCNDAILRLRAGTFCNFQLFIINTHFQHIKKRSMVSGDASKLQISKLTWGNTFLPVFDNFSNGNYKCIE